MRISHTFVGKKHLVLDSTNFKARILIASLNYFAKAYRNFPRIY